MLAAGLIALLLLGIFLLGERPAPEEFAGMAAILLTTAQIEAKAGPSLSKPSSRCPSSEPPGTPAHFRK